MIEEITPRNDPNATKKDQQGFDLRQVLAQLGNRLVQEYEFLPASLVGCSNYCNHTTEPLVRFLVWLENTPEVHFLLQEMGLWQEGLEEKGMSTLNRKGDDHPATNRGELPIGRKKSAC